jgi:hypothetical protein
MLSLVVAKVTSYQIEARDHEKTRENEEKIGFLEAPLSTKTDTPSRWMGYPKGNRGNRWIARLLLGVHQGLQGSLHGAELDALGSAEIPDRRA